MSVATDFENALHEQRLTDASIDSLISSEHYWQVPGTLLTVCALVLWNGFTVLGESACATPAIFDAEVGKRVARENAKKEIKPLACFALRDRLLATGVSR